MMPLYFLPVLPHVTPWSTRHGKAAEQRVQCLSWRLEGNVAPVAAPQTSPAPSWRVLSHPPVPAAPASAPLPAWLVGVRRGMWWELYCFLNSFMEIIMLVWVSVHFNLNPNIMKLLYALLICYFAFPLLVSQTHLPLSLPVHLSTPCSPAPTHQGLGTDTLWPAQLPKGWLRVAGGSDAAGWAQWLFAHPGTGLLSLPWPVPHPPPADSWWVWPAFSALAEIGVRWSHWCLSLWSKDDDMQCCAATATTILYLSNTLTKLSRAVDWLCQ